jgi:hypothetical protein
MGIQRSTAEYNRVREWELSQLSAGVSHGKLVEVGEELEVGLWRLSVWLEDLVTARLF